MRASSSWGELQEALRSADLELAPKGGGLVLRCVSNPEEAHRASELGYAYSTLIRRFGAGFPGHPHTWLVGRVLGRADDDRRIE